MTVGQPFGPATGTHWCRLGHVDDPERIIDLEQTIDIAPIGNSWNWLAVNDPLCLGISAFGERRQKSEPPKVLTDIGQPDNGPLVSQSTFAPQNLGATIGATFKTARVVVFHIREMVATIGNRDESRADATDPGPANFAMPDRIKQNAEAAKVGGMHWPNATDGHPIFEFTLIVRWRDNRSVDRQDIEPRTILPAVVAKFNDVALPKLVQHLGQLIVTSSLPLAYRIEKRVPYLGRNLEGLTGLNFLEAIGHYLAFRL